MKRTKRLLLTLSEKEHGQIAEAALLDQRTVAEYIRVSAVQAATEALKQSKKEA